MIYLTLIGNHDAITPEKSGGAALTIFRAYQEKIIKVYLFATKDTENFKYHDTSHKTKRIMESEKKGVKVEVVDIELTNPIDFDLVYQVLYDESQKIIRADNLEDHKKIINITSGTPTMTACWILLQKSELIPNAILVQSFETQFQRQYGKTCQEVNLEIDNFPEITAPTDIKRELIRANAELKVLKAAKTADDLDSKIPILVGKSKAIREIKEQIIEEINADTHVLIVGEPGTGKEVVARSIWNQHRSMVEKDLLVFDCGQFQPDLIISELFGYKKGAFTGASQDRPGIVEKAANRMLYLDEIGSIPVGNQGVFMRFLQFGEYKVIGDIKINTVDTQIIAATNRDINDPAIFKPDLRDRFDEVIYLPPLREKQDDIELLAREFLNRSDKNVSFGRSVFRAIKNLPWPGNVRQLKMWIERLQRKYSNVKLEWEDIPDRLKTGDVDFDADRYSFPNLPIDYNKYFESLRHHALYVADNNIAEADRLLCFKPGTMKQWLYQRKLKRV